jgi:polyisoprenoid-binding protein YceI
VNLIVPTAIPVSYTVSLPESSLTVEARSTLHAIRATGSGISGHVVVAWNPDGTLSGEPAPVMHVEFPIDRVRSGNAMQDREMLKMVGAARSPKVAADLRSSELLSPPNRYKASGDITLSGRTRAYSGEFTIADEDDGVTLVGDLTVDIRDFGLKPPSLFLLKVDPVLRVRLRLVARRAA